MNVQGAAALKAAALPLWQQDVMKLEFPVEKSQRDFWTHFDVRRGGGKGGGMGMCTYMYVYTCGCVGVCGCASGRTTTYVGDKRT